MSTIVLVHGLWSDGSCWSETIQELRKLGHEPVAAQLTLNTLDEDVAIVRRVLSTVEGPVLLAGWSYGGMVISNAAYGSDQVAALAFVAAFVPEEGETVHDIATRHPGSELSSHLRATEDGYCYLDRRSYGSVMAPEASTQRTALAGAVQKFASLSISALASGPPAWRTIPSHYVIAATDKLLPVQTQLELAERIQATTFELNSGHGVVYSHPIELAKHLDAITNAW